MNRTAPARFPYCPFYPIHPPRTETDETLSGLMGQLREQGYRTYLNTHLALIHTGPEVLTVNVVYQLKGSSDPGNELFLYAISMQPLKKISGAWCAAWPCPPWRRKCPHSRRSATSGKTELPHLNPAFRAKPSVGCRLGVIYVTS
jgi:hypothetical protein